MSLKNVDTANQPAILDLAERTQQGERSMLVLTVKDKHRIALFQVVHDEQILLGWLTFHAPVTSQFDPSWSFEDTTDGAESYFTKNFITTLMNRYRIRCEVKPHSRTQWQASFDAPWEVRLLREKAVEKHGFGYKPATKGARNA